MSGLKWLELQPHYITCHMLHVTFYTNSCATFNIFFFIFHHYHSFSHLFVLFRKWVPFACSYPFYILTCLIYLCSPVSESPLLAPILFMFWLVPSVCTLQKVSAFCSLPCFDLSHLFVLFRIWVLFAFSYPFQILTCPIYLCSLVSEFPSLWLFFMF